MSGQFSCRHATLWLCQRRRRSVEDLELAGCIPREGHARGAVRAHPVRLQLRDAQAARTTVILMMLPPKVGPDRGRSRPRWQAIADWAAQGQEWNHRRDRRSATSASRASTCRCQACRHRRNETNSGGQPFRGGCWAPAGCEPLRFARAVHASMTVVTQCIGTAPIDLRAVVCKRPRRLLSVPGCRSRPRRERHGRRTCFARHPSSARCRLRRARRRL